VSWINAAILSAAVMGLVNVIDSHLLSRRLPSLGSYLLPVGIFQLIYGLILLVIFPLPGGLEVLPLVAAISASILRAVAITIMLYTLTREDVSRVIPVVHIYPIFVAITAVVLLDESLVYLQWLAIFIVVAGAVMVSLKQSPSGNNIRVGKPFILLFASSLLVAGADVTSKYALQYISFLNLYGVGSLCMAFFFLSVSVRSSVFQELRTIKQRGSAIALFILNQLLAPVGIALSFWAIGMGPVSLVSTILSSRPIFVFIYALVLGRFFPVFLEWHPTRTTLVIRVIATAMIFGGIAIIQLI